MPRPSSPVRLRLDDAGFPYGDSVESLSLPTSASASTTSINTSSNGFPATRPRRGSIATIATTSAISARTAFKIPGALLLPSEPPVPKVQVKVLNRTAYEIPGALLLPEPKPEPQRQPQQLPQPQSEDEEMPINSRKVAKSVGKALAKPFTAGSMYAAGGEFHLPVAISTPGDARGRPYGRAPVKSEKEKEKDKEEAKDKEREREAQTPAGRQATLAPTQPSVPSKLERESQAVLRAPDHPPSERQHSPLLGLQLPSDNPRPESGLLPVEPPIPSTSGAGYQHEKHAIMASPILRPVDDVRTRPMDDSRTERWSERMYPDSKHSSSSQTRSADDAEDYIRQLFNALPPEAQALAFARLAEQREREALLTAKRDRETQWERDAEVRREYERREQDRRYSERREQERRERERAREQYRAPGDSYRDHYAAYDDVRDYHDAYDGYRPQPSSRPLPAPVRALPQPRGEIRGLRRQGSGHQLPPQRRESSRMPRSDSAPQDLEAQLAQLLEAQTLPPLPTIPRQSTTPVSRRDSDANSFGARHASPSSSGAPPPSLGHRPSVRGGRSSTSSTSSTTPVTYPLGPVASVPRALSEPSASAPRTALPPRPFHASPHASPTLTYPRTMSPTQLPPDVPVELSAPPQPVTPRTKAAAGGDSEVRAALAAKIRSLQAVLDTLDVANDDEDVPGEDSLSPNSTAPLELYPRPPVQLPLGIRQRLSSVPSLEYSDAHHEPETPTRSAGPVTPRQVLDLNLDLHAPRPRPAGNPPSPLALPSLHLPDEDSVPRSRPSSELGADDHLLLDIEHDSRTMPRMTPPPEYATVGPHSSII